MPDTVPHPEPPGRASFADRAVGWLMALAHARPRTVLAGLGTLMVLAILAATRLGIDADSSRMLDPDLPAQARAQALNDAFPTLKSAIVIAISADQADAADMAAAALVERLQGSDAVSDIFAPAVDPYMTAHGFLYRDLATVEQNFTRLSKSANMLARLRSERTLNGFLTALEEALLLTDRAEIEPDALERLFAETAAVLEAETAGRPRMFGWSTVLDDANAGPVTRLVSVQPVLDTGRLSPARPALDAIQAAIADLPVEIAVPVEIGVTGEPALRAEEMASVTASVGLSLALSLLLVAVILRLGLKGTGPVVLALAALIVSLVLTTGLAAATVGTLNLISIAFIVLMVGLGIDFAIHILAHVDEQRRHGAGLADAVRVTGRRTGLALGLAATTTALAFLAFAVTDFRGMAQLGLIGGPGVIVAFLVACLMIPALLALAPRLAGRVPPPAQAEVPAPAKAPAALGPALVLALAVAAIWPAAEVRFDPDPMGLRDPDAPSVLAFRMLAETPETSPYRASVLVESAAEADRIAAEAEEIDAVGGAVNFGDLVPERQDEKLMLLDLAAPSIDHAVAGQPTALLSEGPAPETDRLAALAERLQDIEGMSQRLYRAIADYQTVRTQATDAALETRLFRAFPLMMTRLEAMLDADRISRETLPAAIRDRFVNAEGLYRVEIRPAADLRTPGETEAFADALSGLDPPPAGGPVQLAAAGQTVAGAMLTATLLAAAMTGALAWAATRRLVDALAILVPLGIAGLFVAAASTLLGMPFNYANVIVLPLMIGIGVDSGIHIALRERRAPGAVFATSTPRAVLVSAMTTVAAFGTLALSDHRGTASMGIMLGIAMLATVVSVLALTPAMIRWARRRGAGA